MTLQELYEKAEAVARDWPATDHTPPSFLVRIEKRARGAKMVVIKKPRLYAHLMQYAGDHLPGR